MTHYISSTRLSLERMKEILDNKEKIDKVYVTSTRGGVKKEMEAAYDAASGKYKASGYFDNEYIYSRGTIDDKGSVFAILESLNDLIKDGFQPEADLYIAFSHTEGRNHKNPPPLGSSFLLFGWGSLSGKRVKNLQDLISGSRFVCCPGNLKRILAAGSRSELAWYRYPLTAWDYADKTLTGKTPRYTPRRPLSCRGKDRGSPF